MPLLTRRVRPSRQTPGVRTCPGAIDECLLCPATTPTCPPAGRTDAADRSAGPLSWMPSKNVRADATRQAHPGRTGSSVDDLIRRSPEPGGAIAGARRRSSSETRYPADRSALGYVTGRSRRLLAGRDPVSGAGLKPSHATSSTIPSKRFTETQSRRPPPRPAASRADGRRLSMEPTSRRRGSNPRRLHQASQAETALHRP